MVYYLTQVRGVPNPLADVPAERPAAHKWPSIGRVHDTICALWRKREFAALVRYPFYALNRLYFYRKGQRDGMRLYRQPPPSSHVGSRTGA